MGRFFQWDTDHIFHQTDWHRLKHTHTDTQTHSLTERCDEMWEGQLCDQYHEQESAMGRIRQWPIRLRLTSPCMCGRPVTIDWPRNPMALADRGEKKRRQMKRKIANALQAGILICDRGGIWWKPLSHSYPPLPPSPFFSDKTTLSDCMGENVLVCVCVHTFAYVCVAKWDIPNAIHWTQECRTLSM